MIWFTAVDDDPESVITYIFFGVAALNLVLAMALAFLTCVRTSGGPGNSLDFYIALGSIAALPVVIVPAIPSEWNASTSVWSALCQAMPIVTVLSGAWIIGAMLVRVISIIVHMRAKSVRSQEWKANLGMMILMIMHLAPCLVWIIHFKLALHGNFCEGDKADEWRLGYGVVLAIELAVATVLIFPALHVSRKTQFYQETTILSIVLGAQIMSALAGSFVYHFLEKTDRLRFPVCAGVLMFAVFFTLLMLIINRILSGDRKIIVGSHPHDPYMEVVEEDDSRSDLSERSSRTGGIGTGNVYNRDSNFSNAYSDKAVSHHSSAASSVDRNAYTNRASSLYEQPIDESDANSSASSDAN